MLGKIEGRRRRGRQRMRWLDGTSWNQDSQTNINNLRYEDDTTLMTESKEKLKSLLMKVKEESEKVGLKLTLNQEN